MVALCAGLSAVRAYAFPGAIHLPPTAQQGYQAQGSVNWEFFGVTVADVGDLNHDGKADFAIVSRPPVGAGPTTGSIYVVFDVRDLATDGRLDLTKLNGTNGFRLDAPSSYAMGSHVSHCDFDGDGNDDLVFGAPGWIPDNLPYGAVYVIYGHAGAFPASIDLAALTSDVGVRIVGGTSYGEAGASMACVGDFDGDGKDDIAIGTGEQALNVYLVYGRSARPQTDIALASLAVHDVVKFAGSSYGSVLAMGSLGDVNHDGKPDFAFTCVPDSITSACIVYGGATLPTTTQVAALAPPLGSYISNAGNFGAASFAFAGDINGDGIDDFVAGGASPTIATIIFGKEGGYGDSLDTTTLDQGTGWQITDSANLNGGFAKTVSGGRDVDGDGLPDILLGMSFTLSEGEYSYLLSSRLARTGFTTDISTLSGLNGTEICSTNISGGSVAAALLGDVDGDGLNDMIVGVPDGFPISTINRGGAFVIKGSDRILGDGFDATPLAPSQVCFY
jgi:hypothetical protein